MTEDPFDQKTHQQWVNENWKLGNYSIEIRATILTCVVLCIGIAGFGWHRVNMEKTLPERMERLYQQYDVSREELESFRSSQETFLDRAAFKREYNKRSKSAQDIWDKMCEMDDGITLNRFVSQSRYYGVCKK